MHYKALQCALKLGHGLLTYMAYALQGNNDVYCIVCISVVYLFISARFAGFLLCVMLKSWSRIRRTWIGHHQCLHLPSRHMLSVHCSQAAVIKVAALFDLYLWLECTNGFSMTCIYSCSTTSFLAFSFVLLLCMTVHVVRSNWYGHHLQLPNALLGAPSCRWPMTTVNTLWQGTSRQNDHEANCRSQGHQSWWPWP